MGESAEDIFRPRELTQKETELLASLQTIEEVTVMPALREQQGESTFKIQLTDEESLTSMYISCRDTQDTKEIAITNLNAFALNRETTNEEMQRKGKGGKAVRKILQWAKENGYPVIMALRVKDTARGFWTKMGFKPYGWDLSDDWLYQEK